jgi:hypothetical protein
VESFYEYGNEPYNILPEFYEEYNLAVQVSEERITSVLGAER